MRLITTVDLTTIDCSFEPVSIFVDSFQVFTWTYSAGVVYFDSTISAGADLQLIPTDTPRFIGDSAQQIVLTDTGHFSVYSKPFGVLEFSLFGTVWKKVLVVDLPATIYVRHIATATELDPICDASIEILLWSGGTDMYIDNVTGYITVQTTLPSGATNGGFEYNVN